MTGSALSKQLEGWLNAVDRLEGEASPSRAIISPYDPGGGGTEWCGSTNLPTSARHAGYSFSGPTAAWAYRAIVPSIVCVASAILEQQQRLSSSHILLPEKASECSSWVRLTMSI